MKTVTYVILCFIICWMGLVIHGQSKTIAFLYEKIDDFIVENQNLRVQIRQL